MLFQMAALALTWSDLERSKSRSRIFRRAVTWKRFQIGPWGFFYLFLIFFFFFKFFFLFFYFFFYFFFKFFSYIFSLCPIPFCPIPCPYPLTPNQIRVRDGIANWAPGPVASSYPIPHKGMGSCSSLVSCTLLLLSHPP